MRCGSCWRASWYASIAPRMSPAWWSWTPRANDSSAVGGAGDAGTAGGAGGCARAVAGMAARARTNPRRIGAGDLLRDGERGLARVEARARVGRDLQRVGAGRETLERQRARILDAAGRIGRGQVGRHPPGPLVAPVDLDGRLRRRRRVLDAVDGEEEADRLAHGLAERLAHVGVDERLAVHERAV